MPDRQLIQLILIEPPFWHELIHQAYETGVMSRLQQMDHLMYDDVFEALRRLLGKLRIKPDTPGVRATAAHFVFIRCTKKRFTLTPITGSHFEIKAGTASLRASRYQDSRMFCFVSRLVAGRIRRIILLCFNSTFGAVSFSSILSR